jgi:PAS domain S-box-containing protein
VDSESIIRDLEARLAASEREVKATREMFQLAVDSIPWCVWWKDTEGRYLGVNRSLVEAAGLSDVTQMIGKYDPDLWAPEDAIKYRMDDKRVMETGRPEYGIMEKQERSDGKTYHLETNKIPLRDAQGQVIGSLGTFQDVTERQMMQEELKRHRDDLELLVEARTRELEEEIAERHAAQTQLAEQAQELVEANQALRDAEKAKSAFFANVSHELRTPLTLILAPLESALAGSYGSLEDGLADALKTVHNSAVRLLELVTSILDISRLEAGKMTANPVPVELERLLETILGDFLPLAAKRRQELSWELRSEQPLMTDPYLLERIVFNLVSNALKFTPPGGAIQVRASVAQDWLSLQVSDDGIGIAAEDLPQLFRKFSQVESSYTRRFEGTGLGLAMVREFAHLLGGDVELSSSPGRGSTFTVRVPAPPAQPQLPAAASSRLSRPQAQVDSDWAEVLDGEGADILIAEDNEDLARYVAETLRPLGTIGWACDGEVALRMARQCKPVLIVSDVMMPNRDGMWLCRQVRREFPDDPPPVLLLTALSERKALLEGWDAGAADFLHKPFHPLELTTRVRSLLQARRQRLAALEERRQLEERLFESQRLDSLGLMAGGIAHDFNNLLAVVTGHLELAECSAPLSEAVKECLQEAALAAQRAAGLSRQMLTYVGKMPPRKAPLDLALAARETAQMLERGLLSKPLLHLDLSPATVAADRSQIDQVVLNLITNGAESVTDGARAVLEVQTGVADFSAEFLGEKEGGRFAFLRVQDNGCGMDEETRKRIFDPFFTTKFTGRGLGLAAVHGILRSHSARCRIVSQPGQGTTFWVLFSPSAEAAEHRLPQPGQGWRGQGTILLVEDEPQVRGMMARMLRYCGFQVHQASCAEEARTLLEREHEPYRAALIDVILPDSDGQDLARLLQSMEPGLQCLLCSGFQGSAERNSGFKVLLKPFSMGLLQQSLRELLEGLSGEPDGMPRPG